MAPRTAKPSKKSPVEELVEEEVEEVVEEVEEDVEDDEEVASSDEEEEKPKKKAAAKPKPAAPKKGKSKKETSDDEDNGSGSGNESAGSGSKRAVTSSIPKVMLDAVYEKLKKEGSVTVPKKDDLKHIMDVFVKTIVQQVQEGKKVTFTNYFTFKRGDRNERTHAAPKSGITVTKPAHHVMTMEVKPALKQAFADLPFSPTPKGRAAKKVEEEVVESEEEEEKPKKKAATKKAK